MEQIQSLVKTILSQAKPWNKLNAPPLLINTLGSRLIYSNTLTKSCIGHF